MAASEEFLFVIRRFTNVREEVEERSYRDPVPDVLVNAVEQLVQRLLGVAVRAFKVGVVAATRSASTTSCAARLTHQEGTWPNTALAVRNTFHDVPDQESRKILGENALRVFNFDDRKIREIAARIGPNPADVTQPVHASELPEHRGFAFRERGQYS